jgi:hypothetical protein
MSLPLTVNYDYNFKKDDPYQLHIAIHSENKVAMLRRLKQIVEQMESDKPMQGTVSQYDCTCFVQTPIWACAEY